MKPTLLLITLTLISCAQGNKESGSSNDSGPCAGASIKGTWTLHPNGGDTLTLGASCVGSSSSCNQSFTYSMPDQNWNITVTTTDPQLSASCLPVGNTVCAVNVSGPWLSIDCGAGTNTYRRN